MKKIIFFILIVIIYFLYFYPTTEASNISINYYPVFLSPTPMVKMESRNYKLEILKLEKIEK